MNRISLYNIEDALTQLVELREQAEVEGDSEALKVIDEQLQQYLKNEATKIDSIAGIIRQLGTDAATVKAEADRLYDRAKVMEARRDAIKSAALAAMQAHEIKALKTATNTLRRQGNGGLQPLDIPEWPRDASGNFKPQPSDIRKTVMIPMKLLVVPDTDKIREALKLRVKCDKCGGIGKRAQLTDYEMDRCESTGTDPSICPRCNGEGTIPNSIPGVKLLPKGEHLRVE